MIRAGGAWLEKFKKIEGELLAKGSCSYAGKSETGICVF
jgi:hypothetical protein